VVREPKTAAVLLSVAPKAETTLAEILRKTRPLAAEIPGLFPVSIKKAQAGGLLLQISGGEGHRLADELAAKMWQVAGETPGVRVGRPLKRAELRLQGLDDSVTREEIIESVTGLTGCRAEDLAVGEIKFLPNRLGSVWLRCPVAASNKMLEEGKWRIGWATVTAKPLPARLMRCFRCLEVGHGAADCTGVDRSGRCHRCGDRSHQSNNCGAERPKCPLCADFGLPAVHSLGAAACVSSRRAVLRKLANMAREKEKAREGESSKGTPSTDSGGRSKGGPRRENHPPETSTSAGPAGEERGTRPTAGEGPSSSTPKKGFTDGGGGCSGRPSLKRTASERSSSAQRGREIGKEPTGQMPPPLTMAKKKRDRRGRFSTR